MSPYAELNPENESGEHQQQQQNSNINTSTNSLSSSTYSSHILEDIEAYLNTYSNDFPELVVGACWWADSLSKLNQTIPKENIKRFRKELIIGLRDRIKGHWYPDSPERGQGYRAVVCEETTDRLLMDAAKKSDINGNFRSFFKQNTTMWIDPGNVTYRHGKHYEKTLYPFNHNSNSTTTNILNNSFLMVMNSSSNTTPTSSSTVSTLSSSSTTTTTTTQQTTPNKSTTSLLNSNTIYNPIYFNPNQPQTTPPPRSTPTSKNSPQLSSSAPAFSPSSSVYHSLLSQPPLSQATPPTSPLKDFQQKQIDSNNTTSSSSSNNSNVYSRPTNSIKQNYL